MEEQLIKPDYYKGKSGQEASDVIDDFELGFNLGNVIKYVLRAGKKTEDPSLDLGKAKEYIDKELKKYKD